MEGAIILIVILVLYFLPTIIAERKRSFGSVFVINLFLGWTLVGWVVALAWALKDDPPPLGTMIVQPHQVPPLLCSNCGKYSAADSQFCAQCGNPLAA